MSSIVKITESFMLRRIDPVDILRKYLAGQFKNKKIPEKSVTISNTFVSLGKSLGTNPSSESYRLADKTNTGKVIVTTNHKTYQYEKDKNENRSTERPKVLCQYCKRLLTKDHPGIPIEMEVNERTGNAKFYVDGSFCHFGCAYASLKREIGVSKCYRDPLYMDSEQMLYCLYYRVHPDKRGSRINESPDWRLLDENGGPLSSKDFDAGTCEYVKIPQATLLPAKKQYIRLVLPKQ